MHYVIIATHTADICPTANAKTRDLTMQMGPDVPRIAEKAGVTIIAGPYVSREHVSVAIVEAKTGEDLDQFLMESRLPMWNSVKVLPSVTMEEGMQEIQTLPTIF